MCHMIQKDTILQAVILVVFDTCNILGAKPSLLWHLCMCLLVITGQSVLFLWIPCRWCNEKCSVQLQRQMIITGDPIYFFHDRK